MDLVDEVTQWNIANPGKSKYLFAEKINQTKTWQVVEFVCSNQFCWKILNLKSILIKYYLLLLVYMSTTQIWSDIILRCSRLSTSFEAFRRPGKFSQSLNRWYTMNFRLTIVIFLFSQSENGTKKKATPYTLQFNLPKKQLVYFFSQTWIEYAPYRTIVYILG